MGRGVWSGKQFVKFFTSAGVTAVLGGGGEDFERDRELRYTALQGAWFIRFLERRWQHQRFEIVLSV
jgi:hypothetical protein